MHILKPTYILLHILYPEFPHRGNAVTSYAESCGLDSGRGCTGLYYASCTIFLNYTYSFIVVRFLILMFNINKNIKFLYFFILCVYIFWHQISVTVIFPISIDWCKEMLFCGLRLIDLMRCEAPRRTGAVAIIVSRRLSRNVCWSFECLAGGSICFSLFCITFCWITVTSQPLYESLGMVFCIVYCICTWMAIYWS